MNVLNLIDTNDQFPVEPELADILSWMRMKNPDKRTNLKSNCEVITLSDAAEAGLLSLEYQWMKLCEKHIDPLNLSPISAAIVPHERLVELVSYQEELSQNDFTNDDPGLFLLLKRKMRERQIRRWSRYHFLIINSVEQFREMFSCLGRYTFFREWRWLLPKEFDEAKADMAAMAKKYDWPLIESPELVGSN